MKKGLIIAIIAIAALGALGIGYAAWSQTMDIHGTAAVGTFNVSMDYNGGANDLKTIVSNGNTYTEGTDFTNTTAAPNGAGFKVTADPKTGQNNGTAGLTVLITNAVPGVYRIPGVVIHNGSTIPVKVTVGSPVGDAQGVGATLMNPAWVSVGAGLTNTDPLAASGATTAADITITIPDGAAQSTTYGFKIPVTVEQK